MGIVGWRMDKADLDQLEWLAKNKTTTDAQASALAGLAVVAGIEQFEKSSDKLGRRMLTLTWVLVALTLGLAVLTVWLIAKA